MATRLIIWLQDDDPDAGHPSTWEVIMRCPVAPLDPLIYEGLPFDHEPIWGTDSQDAFVEWLQEHAPDAVFEFHHPADPRSQMACSCGSLVIPNPDHAFHARNRWGFLRVADW